VLSSPNVPNLLRRKKEIAEQRSKMSSLPQQRQEVRADWPR